jgi:hypothetical protein
MITADAKLLVTSCSVAHFDELMDKDTPRERVHLPHLARQMVVKTGLTNIKVLFRRIERLLCCSLHPKCLAVCLTRRVSHNPQAHLGAGESMTNTMPSPAMLPYRNCR